MDRRLEWWWRGIGAARRGSHVPDCVCLDERGHKVPAVWDGAGRECRPRRSRGVLRGHQGRRLRTPASLLRALLLLGRRRRPHGCVSARCRVPWSLCGQIVRASTSTTGVSRDGHLTAPRKIGRRRGTVCRAGGRTADARRGVAVPGVLVILHGDYFDDSGSRLQPALREAAVCAFPRSRWGGDAVEHDFSVKSVTNDDESPLLRGAGVCRGA